MLKMFIVVLYIVMTGECPKALWSCSPFARGTAVLLLHKGSNHSGAPSA